MYVRIGLQKWLNVLLSFLFLFIARLDISRLWGPWNDNFKFLIEKNLNGLSLGEFWKCCYLDSLHPWVYHKTGDTSDCRGKKESIEPIQSA